MKIVVLDGFTLNPGDLSWDSLRAHGDCEIFDRTPPDQFPARSAHADILLTNKTRISRDHFASLPKLKYIGVLATGTNVVDLVAARERNIPVTNVPAYGTRSVAQATMARIFSIASRMFSTLLANEKRKYPSPIAPKHVPERHATPASSSRRFARSLDDTPVFAVLGNT